MAREGVLLQVFLDQRRKSVEPLAHVGTAERQVHPTRRVDGLLDLSAGRRRSPKPEVITKELAGPRNQINLVNSAS